MTETRHLFPDLVDILKASNPMRIKPWAVSTKEEVAKIDATVFWLAWTEDSRPQRFVHRVLILVI